MTDPIWPARPSYRPSHRRRGPNRQLRRLLLAATVLMVALLTLLGGGLLLRPDGPVPVIEAENRPLRVPPDNPSGLQVPGLADQVLGDQADFPVALAPPPKEPAATALRAQTEASEEPKFPIGPTDSPAAADTALPEASTDAPLSKAGRPSIKQQVTPVIALLIPRASPSSQPGRGTSKVQLAAVGREADARSEWKRLSRKAPELLGGRTPLIERANIQGRTVWRLRLGGFTDRADAIAFCDRLRSAALRCSPIQFR